MVERVSLELDARTLQISIVNFNVDFFDDRLFKNSGIFRSVDIQMCRKKRRCEFFFGRLAAQDSLNNLGIYGFDIKADSAGAPVFPGGIIGSISHTSNFAAACTIFATCHYGLGIDVETVMAGQQAIELSELIMLTQERDLLCATNLEIGNLCTILFSAKESFYKAAYKLVGCDMNFFSITLICIDISRCVFIFSINGDLEKILGVGKEIAIPFVYIDETTVLTYCLF